MRRILCWCVLFVGLGAERAVAQTITVTAPFGGANSVASANDFATTVMQDPWDMNQNTDGGWFVHSVDFPTAGWSSVSFSSGLFSGVVAGSAPPNLWLLETGFAGAAPIGRFGVNFPIDSNRFRVAAIRMCVSQAGAAMYFGWTTNTMFDPPGLQYSNNVFTTTGCRFYIVDFPTLGTTGTEPWAGTKRSLMLVPAAGPTAGSTVNIDWVRLVENQPALSRDITWTGGGPVDIYLDNNNTATNDPNQTLGLVASNVSGSSYSLNVGALEPGNYYVAIRRTGTTGNFSYSSGFYQVNAPATITVTSPSDEGSADDFATIHLNNPWDMTSMSDIDHLINVQQAGIVTVFGAENEAGTPLGNITAFSGSNTLGVFNPDPCTSFAKPAVFLMHANVRGLTRRIDPNRYRILTAELGLPNKARDICNGSIVRIVWHVAGDANETYSDDIILNSRVGANVVSRLNLDMATLPIEPGSPSQTGWVPGVSPNPGIATFRIDPHEFANPTAFYIKRAKLASLDTAHTSFNVQWTTSRTGGTINVYYDSDKEPSVKTLIGSTSASALAGSLSWNTASLPDGAQYFIYVEHNDGVNGNGVYSKWPVVIDHTPSSTVRLVLNRSTLNFGVTAMTIKTPPQILRLTTINGQPCWTATSDLPFLVVSPSSGCGGAALTVSLINQAYQQLGDFSGYIRLSSADALNSPQFVQTVVRVSSTSTPPFGVIDTPANGVTVAGSLAVTGWAVDDISIARVSICRDPVGSEGGHPACGGAQVYIGDAVSIEDSRPDIEGFSPTTPLNYRAGWGFLILTNMMPNQGNGTFTLYAHAVDLEGYRTQIGSRVIFAQNSSATEPFGAIDTPAQGETIGGSNYPNFGWVLSRVRRADPPGGGSVTAYIDGVAVGSPSGWNSRADLSATFPGYPGINTALGVLSVNSTAYANGVHTIAWVVTDNAGVSSGIGSRFFSIFNTGASASAGAMRPVGPDLGRRVDDLGGTVSSVPVAMREGFRLTGPTHLVASGLNATRRVWATERDRLEIRLNPSSGGSSGEHAGYLVVDGRLRELPIGSSFDPARGAFYWQPGLGYIGEYDLLFVRTGGDGVRERIPVRVTLQPRTSQLASSLPSVWQGVKFSR